jgi:biuret amidohydrolase
MQIDANPFPFECELAHTALVIIDMQRDFIEPGGFGESLGNDVALLSAIVPACRAVLGAWGRWATSWSRVSRARRSLPNSRRSPVRS